MGLIHHGQREGTLRFCTERRRVRPKLTQFAHDYPLFQQAYCYYWFYVFLIWYKEKQ